MASANSLQQLAINMVTYLTNVQGQGRVSGAIIAQAIGCNPPPSTDVMQVAAFIRESIPGIPLVGLPDNADSRWRGSRTASTR